MNLIGIDKIGMNRY